MLGLFFVWVVLSSCAILSSSGNALGWKVETESSSVVMDGKLSGVMGGTPIDTKPSELLIPVSLGALLICRGSACP
jgi:hypothetical protein